MDRNRIVAGLDVHKDTIYLCIMGYDEAIIFEKTYGSLTPDLQQMRKYNRCIFDLKDDLVYNTNKLDAVLQRCVFRLSNFVTQVNGKSYQSVINKIAEGETSPEELAKLVHGRTVNKHGKEKIIAAVTANFHKADIDMIKQIRETIQMLERHIDECQKELTAMCKEHIPKELKRLQTIPAVKEREATAMIAHGCR